jgi:hypothetical protein
VFECPLNGRVVESKQESSKRERESPDVVLGPGFTSAEALLGNQWWTMTSSSRLQGPDFFFLHHVHRSAKYIETISKWPEDLRDAIAIARTRSV